MTDYDGISSADFQYGYQVRIMSEHGPSESLTV